MSWVIHCMKSLQIQSFFWSIFFYIRTRNNSVFARSSHSDSFEILWMNYAFSNSFSLKYASVRIISVTWEWKTPHVFSLLYNSKHHSWLFCFVQSFTSNKLHNSFFFHFQGMAEASKFRNDFGSKWKLC